MIGIYKITNKINGKIYIGQSKSIGQRWANHINRLECNKHVNKELQNDYNIFGYSNFIFEIVEECNEEELLILEQKYIKTYGSNLYNIVNNNIKNINYNTNKNNILKSHDNYCVDFNILNSNIYKLSINAQKIILYCYKEYYYTKENYIELSAINFENEFNINRNMFYRDSVKYYEELLYCNIFSKVKLENKSILCFEFNDEFINTNNNIFINYNNIVKNTKHKYTIPILLNILKYNNLTIKVDDFRKKFNCETYNNSRLKNKIINTFLEDCNNIGYNIKYNSIMRLKVLNSLNFKLN